MSTPHPGSPEERDELTRILNRLGGGAPGSEAEARELEAWIPTLVAELRRVAGAQLRGKIGHTLQPTALVHEVYLRLFAGAGQWKDRRHFFTVAARAMRQILVDHARGKGRIKRGSGRLRITLDERMTAAAVRSEDSTDVLDLHDALGALGSHDELQSRIVELRFFAGLGVEEVADVLALSKSTVEREWRAARAWLGVRMESMGA